MCFVLRQIIFEKRKKITNTVVYANESEHNPQQASLKTRAGYMPENHVNRHLGRKVFKFEGLKDLADLAEKGDYAVSYDLKSGYYHVGLHPRSRTFVGFKWEGK